MKKLTLVVAENEVKQMARRSHDVGFCYKIGELMVSAMASNHQHIRIEILDTGLVLLNGQNIDPNAAVNMN
jgi:hypothetical protein